MAKNVLEARQAKFIEFCTKSKHKEALLAYLESSAGIDYDSGHFKNLNVSTEKETLQHAEERLRESERLYHQVFVVLPVCRSPFHLLALEHSLQPMNDFRNPPPPLLHKKLLDPAKLHYDRTFLLDVLLLLTCASIGGWLMAPARPRLLLHFVVAWRAFGFIIPFVGRTFWEYTLNMMASARLRPRLQGLAMHTCHPLFSDQGWPPAHARCHRSWDTFVLGCCWGLCAAVIGAVCVLTTAVLLCLRGGDNFVFRGHWLVAGH